jgi:hypothetical protein
MARLLSLGIVHRYQVPITLDPGWPVKRLEAVPEIEPRYAGFPSPYPRGMAGRAVLTDPAEAQVGNMPVRIGSTRLVGSVPAPARRPSLSRDPGMMVLAERRSQVVLAALQRRRRCGG